MGSELRGHADLGLSCQVVNFTAQVFLEISHLGKDMSQLQLEYGCLYKIYVTRDQTADGHPVTVGVQLSVWFCLYPRISHMTGNSTEPRSWPIFKV